MVIDLKIGIIGGSGLEDPNLISNSSVKEISTPFGEPSSPLVFGKIADIPIIII